MASKRKSTTPCMVLAREPDPDVEMNSDVEEGPPLPAATESTAPKSTVPEAAAKEEDALEPNESDNQPSKLVEEHNTKHHPGEENFKLAMVKRNNQTIFEQTVNDLTFDGSFVQEDNQEQSESNLSSISISKTPIMKIMKDKSEKKKISVPQNTTEEEAEETDLKVENQPKAQPPEEPKIASVITEPAKPTATIVTKVPELANPVMAPTTLLQPSLAQVITTVQAQQNFLPKVLIPVSSIPTYNTAMDNNPLLLGNYNKFPYPTVSEISLLANQTKCTEEQIKIWFSAQRLKHGVSWTPEEVEEARRKQFNGTVHTVPQTITVIPAQISSAANGLPSILQTCQIVGQPGLVLTQVGANTLPVSTPIALTVAGVPNSAQLHASQISQVHPMSETKRIAAIPSPQLPKQEPSMLADIFGLRAKKSKEQLNALKMSYLRNQYPHNSEIERLIRLTGLTKGEIKKWFSDTRYNQRNSKNSHGMHFTSDASGAIIIDSSDETNESPTSVIVATQRRQSWNPFPDFTPQKFKEKSVEQVQALEESFQNNSVPSDEELNKLRVHTKLTKREIDAWFAERRRSLGIKEEPGAVNDSLETEIKEEMDDESQAAFVAAKMAKKSPEQLTVLKNMFVRTQWPTPAEYDQLVQETGLARSDIVGWFGDTRYAAKNNHLKWYYEYQVSKNANQAVMNGQGSTRRRGRGRPKGKGRGRPRGRPRGRRTSWERIPAPVKQKTGKALLKDYYLMHKFLNEEDLDDLVGKSQMGYEQVRDWFAERMQREDAGLDPFEDEEEDEDNLLDDQDDEEEIESDDSDTWEPPKHVKRRLSKMED
ncbi:zinc fingers and homeoboxes protein 1 isoform X2 [Hyperolius riggenbachi]|uniref:zinc fingers and homeoboxes protein 1 isoform X2 n=1 Tax=Hyperolius riggenbachi TaxID=752182 RepID=UPI0035A2C060